MSAKPNKVLPTWVYHNRNLSFHAWDTQVCNNFGISEDSYYSLLYLLVMIWWGQNIHAIQKEFWKQNPLYFWSVLQSHETYLFEALVSACIHKVWHTRQASKARWQSEVCSFNIFLFDNVWLVCFDAVKARDEEHSKNAGPASATASSQAPGVLGRHAPCWRFA